MSSTLVHHKPSAGGQLKFSWMEPTAPTSVARPHRSANWPAAENGSPLVKVRPAIKTRIGEVRLGSVMLALLKQYGITDEEIAAVLASE